MYFNIWPPANSVEKQELLFFSRVKPAVTFVFEAWPVCVGMIYVFML